MKGKEGLLWDLYHLLEEPQALSNENLSGRIKSVPTPSLLIESILNYLRQCREGRFGLGTADLDLDRTPQGRT